MKKLCALCLILLLCLTCLPVLASGEAVVTCSSADAAPGETVTVELTVTGNPGFTVLCLGLDYDETVLTLRGVENAIDGFILSEGKALLWDGERDYTGAAVAHLTFAVADGAAAGEYSVTPMFIDAANENMQALEMSVSAGTVTVAPAFTTGDANGDGLVNSDDLTALARHVAKIELIEDPALFEAADVNRDGVVNSDDLTQMARYVAKIITSFD